jgi:hypothetical protein
LLGDKEWKAFEKDSKIIECLGGWYEKCVDHKSKNYTKLSLGGHKVIKSEYGTLNNIWKKFQSKKAFGR